MRIDMSVDKITRTSNGTSLRIILMKDWKNVIPSGFCAFFMCDERNSSPPMKRNISTPDDTFPTNKWKITTSKIAIPRRPSIWSYLFVSFFGLLILLMYLCECRGTDTVLGMESVFFHV